MLSQIADLRRESAVRTLEFERNCDSLNGLRRFGWPVALTRDGSTICAAIYDRSVKVDKIFLVELEVSNICAALGALTVASTVSDKNTEPSSRRSRIAEIDIHFIGSRSRITDVRLFLGDTVFPLPCTPSIEFLLSKFQSLVMVDRCRFFPVSVLPVIAIESIGKTRADELGKYWADKRLMEGLEIERTTGDFPQAIAYYDAALGLVPDHVDALVARGVALMEMEKVDSAIESLEKALEIAPTNRNAIKYIQLARDML